MHYWHLLWHIVLECAMCFYTGPYGAKLYYAVLFCVLQCLLSNAWYCTLLYFLRCCTIMYKLCYLVLYCAMVCHLVLYNAVFFYTTLCYVILCCSMSTICLHMFSIMCCFVSFFSGPTSWKYCAILCNTVLFYVIC